jgi:hypothetical protein
MASVQILAKGVAVEVEPLNEEETIIELLTSEVEIMELEGTTKVLELVKVCVEDEVVGTVEVVVCDELDDTKEDELDEFIEGIIEVPFSVAQPATKVRSRSGTNLLIALNIDQPWLRSQDECHLWFLAK